MTQTFKISGMHCEACTKLTAKRIKTLPGVEYVMVDLESGKADILASREVGLGEVKAVLGGSEYSVEEYYE